MNGTRKLPIKRRYKVLGILSGVLLGIPLLCIGVFVFGAYYGQWRMAEVNQELFALAEQLEYTPDALLQHRVRTRDGTTTMISCTHTSLSPSALRTPNKSRRISGVVT